MTNMEKITKCLEELECSGMIEGFAKCPGVPRFDIFPARSWEYDVDPQPIQIEVIG